MTKQTGAPRKPIRSRLFAYSLGFLFQSRLHRILKAHGWRLSFGLPLADPDAVVVWGRTKVAKRGMFLAAWLKRPLTTVEDAFLRSVRTGRQGDAPIGLILDQTGIYFDTSRACDLDGLLKESLKLSEEEQGNAADQLALMQRLNLSKYNDFTEQPFDLEEDFILVVDQTLDDAAIRLVCARSADFAKMLACAKAENPDHKILIKTHPETIAGLRRGYFSQIDCNDQVGLISTALSPAILFDKARKVYCVTSQMGQEAIFAGHRPHVFGRPFYAGLGLSHDRGPPPEKELRLTPAQLFWATHLHYSKWYDPYFDRAADFSVAALALHAKARQHQDNQAQAVCIGMRLWKRGFLKRYLSGQGVIPRFSDDVKQAISLASETKGRVLVWAGHETAALAAECAKADVPLTRVEDGFLRSVGLGANLVAPVSLAFDAAGIYYDPTRASDLEHLINASGDLTKTDLVRAEAVKARIVALKMTKYNLAQHSEELPAVNGKQIILVPGQVEDDASIQKGAGAVKTNLELLQAVRKDYPDAYIVYKPHPDVEAGLRVGIINADGMADYVAENSNMADLLGQVDRLATMTSLAGFEALLRGIPVTCYGQPFYCGWGLTNDKAAPISRRRARPKLAALIHACLIDYPRYWDPVTSKPCPVEVILERFERGQMRGKTGVGMRLLAKLQGAFASYAYLWR